MILSNLPLVCVSTVLSPSHICNSRVYEVISTMSPFCRNQIGTHHGFTMLCSDDYVELLGNSCDHWFVLLCRRIDNNGSGAEGGIGCGGSNAEDSLEGEEATQKAEENTMKAEGLYDDAAEDHTMMRHSNTVR